MTLNTSISGFSEVVGGFLCGGRTKRSAILYLFAKHRREDDRGMHIGLIGGIGPAATDFYYRGLIDRHRAAGTPLECTIAHADVGTMGRNLADCRRVEQAAIFAGLIGGLKKAGAE